MVLKCADIWPVSSLLQGDGQVEIAGGHFIHAAHKQTHLAGHSAGNNDYGGRAERQSCKGHHHPCAHDGIIDVVKRGSWHHAHSGPSVIFLNRKIIRFCQAQFLSACMHSLHRRLQHAVGHRSPYGNRFPRIVEKRHGTIHGLYMVAKGNKQLFAHAHNCLAYKLKGFQVIDVPYEVDGTVVRSGPAGVAIGLFCHIHRPAAPKPPPQTRLQK